MQCKKTKIRVSHVTDTWKTFNWQHDITSNKTETNICNIVIESKFPYIIRRRSFCEIDSIQIRSHILFTLSVGNSVIVYVSGRVYQTMYWTGWKCKLHAKSNQTENRILWNWRLICLYLAYNTQYPARYIWSHYFQLEWW